MVIVFVISVILLHILALLMALFYGLLSFGELMPEGKAGFLKQMRKTVFITYLLGFLSCALSIPLKLPEGFERTVMLFRGFGISWLIFSGLVLLTLLIRFFLIAKDYYDFMLLKLFVNSVIFSGLAYFCSGLMRYQ